MAYQILAQVQKKIRKGLQKNGTDVARNEADPYGDGDQSLIAAGEANEARQQFYRDLYSDAGDINYLADVGMAPLSEFAKFCIPGDVANMRAMLKQADTNPAKPSEALIQLLEKRETTQRLSPLMMIISMGKNVQFPGGNVAPQQLEAVKLLLEYGARPDARDVCGKTVCHYGMGAFATDMTLEAANFCIAAHYSSHLFGKEVKLHSLKKADMNGLRGLCRGYVASTGRRLVYLLDRNETMAIKPDNLKLCSGKTDTARPKLCDIQDRLGGVALIEVLMKNRVNVAKVLLNKHDAAIDIVNVEGLSPQSMAAQAGGLSDVGQLIMKSAMRHARADRDALDNTCANCGILTVDLLKCGQCHSVFYCSRECQVSHWKRGGHKQECQRFIDDRQQTIILERPPPGGLAHATIRAGSNRIFPARTAFESFRRPSVNAVGDQFYIKIQGGGPAMPLMIYDESREFLAHVNPGQHGFAELRAKVAADPAANGRKTYLKCSFDESDKCTIYLATRSVKLW